MIHIYQKPKWMELAEGELGIKEIAGKEHNQRVLEYHAMTTLKATDDETPWCSSFVNWCIYHSGEMPTRSAAARSWLNWGIELSSPYYGCIVIFRRGTSPTSGHVAFFDSEVRGGFLRVLGGNQANQVCYANYRKADVLGYRWPKNQI